MGWHDTASQQAQGAFLEGLVEHADKGGEIGDFAEQGEPGGVTTWMPGWARF
jgi:hypothetical protein